MSELVRRKAKDIFHVEIEEDEKKLVLAAREGRMKIIMGLLSTNIVDINMDSNIDCYDDSDEEYYMATPLFEAARNGHMDIVCLLLDKGAKPNIPDSYGTSPLMAAIAKGHKEVVKLLIDSGADPNWVDEDKWSPLRVAAAKGHEEVVKLLIDNGADPNIIDANGDTALHVAASMGHIGIIQLLLNIGADPNVSDCNGETPLYAAFEAGHDNVEHLLLEKGARPNKEYYEQKLLMAIEEGSARDVRNHLLSGVNINFDQSRPLKEAVRTGHKDILVLLLSNGANPNNHIDHGYVGMEESPLTMAIKEDKKDLVQILLDVGAKTNEEDRGDLEEWGCFDF